MTPKDENEINEILKRHETYVTLKQPYNTTPIFLKENVIKAMNEFADYKLNIRHT